ncbi:MAG: carbohydrate binding family 9 domain-containing protein, partial [Verrucomicrobiae bacterium]|nr:carbohydrate binding family 9 domain-containing protein [Verrucomicrobiae bacterium]
MGATRKHENVGLQSSYRTYRRADWVSLATRMIVFACVCLCSGIRPLGAHEGAHANVRVLHALKVDAELKVDGVLDEPFWAECEVATGLIDIRTGQPAKDQTLVRVAYTRTHLYIGVECLESDVSQIRATERREDRVFVGDDWVEIHLDPPHNHRGKSAFFTNPLGTKAEANEGPSGIFNYGWSADWECAAKIHKDRWTFEMKIPLGAMNYFRRDGSTWGFNVTRMQRSTDVTSFWNFNPTDMYKPRHFGHLSGLDLADSAFDRNWEVTPYASARMDFDGDTDLVPKAGVDVSFRLTPAVTTAWTIYPDFGHLEADEDTIELRDTERFLPEKRLYFREGDELMRMPHRIYYSRRITEIDAAGKVSGLLPGYSFNVMNVQSEFVHDGRFQGNSTIARVIQGIGERSYLAYYADASHLEQGTSYNGSIDGYFFVTDAWRLRFQSAVSKENLRDPSQLVEKDELDYLGEASAIYDLYPWEFTVSYTAITPNFNPLLGYIPRRDIFGPSALGSWNVRSGSAWYKEIYIDYRPRLFQNETGQTTVRDHGSFARVLFRNDLAVRVGYDHEYHAPFTNRRLLTGLDLWASDFFRAVNLGYAKGEFERTSYDEFQWGKRLKFWEKLPIKHELVLRLEDRPGGESETVWLNRVVVDFYISNDKWIKASIQNLSLIHI